MKSTIKRTLTVLAVLGALTKQSTGSIPSLWDMVCDNYVPGESSNGTCPVPHRARGKILVHPNKILIFGGYGGYVPKSDVWTYNIETGVWREDVRDWREESSNWTMMCDEAAESRLPRTNPAAAYDSSGLVFIGSGTCRKSPTFEENTSASINDYWLYGPDSEKWSKTPSPTANPGVRDAPAAIWNRKIVVFGGYDIAKKEYSDVIWISDIFADPTDNNANTNNNGQEEVPKATVVAPLTGSNAPAARAHHSAVISGDLLYIFGGRNATHTFNDLWKFDLRTVTWKEMVPENPEKGPSPRHSQGAALVPNASPDKGDLLMIFGGQGEDGSFLSDTYFYSFGQHLWSELKGSENTPSPRKDSMMGCSKDGPCWLFGGETEDGFVNDFYMLY